VGGGFGGESQRVLVLGDGDFSVAEFRVRLPEEGIVLISRSLFELPALAGRESTEGQEALGAVGNGRRLAHQQALGAR
jgi:hypothetical protein